MERKNPEKKPRTVPSKTQKTQKKEEGKRADRKGKEGKKATTRLDRTLFLTGIYGLPSSVLLSTACPTSLASDQTKRGGSVGCTENTEVRCPRAKDSF